MKKQSSKKSKFPSIYRSFTEKPLLIVGMGTILLGILVIMGIQAVSIYSLLSQRTIIEKQREEISREILFWEEIAITHPDYPDALFKLAILSYRVKENEKSWEYVKKALFLNPNFIEAKQLAQILQNENR